MRKFIIKRLQNIPKVQHQPERDTLDPIHQWIGFVTDGNGYVISVVVKKHILSKFITRNIDMSYSTDATTGAGTSNHSGAHVRIPDYQIGSQR
jgi:hypothetical protein